MSSYALSFERLNCSVAERDMNTIVCPTTNAKCNEYGTHVHQSIIKIIEFVDFVLAGCVCFSLAELIWFQHG